MKDRKRDILKRILQGNMDTLHAANELQSAKDGKTKVEVWLPIENGLCQEMNSGEILTREELDERLEQDRLRGITVINIPPKHRENE